MSKSLRDSSVGLILSLTVLWILAIGLGVTANAAFLGSSSSLPNAAPHNMFLLQARHIYPEASLLSVFFVVHWILTAFRGGSARTLEANLLLSLAVATFGLHFADMFADNYHNSSLVCFGWNQEVTEWEIRWACPSAQLFDRFAVLVEVALVMCSLAFRWSTHPSYSSKDKI